MYEESFFILFVAVWSIERKYIFLSITSGNEAKGRKIGEGTDGDRREAKEKEADNSSGGFKNEVFLGVGVKSRQ